MAKAATRLPTPGPHAEPPELGHIDGLDLHAEYSLSPMGGDFFDAVRVGPRIAFFLTDIAGPRRETDPIAAATALAFRAHTDEFFSAPDANLMEGTELLVQTINHALMSAANGIRFSPTVVGCYDIQLGLLAYVNAGGQTAMLRDSEGTRPLPNIGMPLGLFTHLTFDASMQAFEPGAKLLVVTKGVIDTPRGHAPFGPQRVLDHVEQTPAASATDLCRTILASAATYEKRPRFHLGRTHLREDRTALAMVRSN